MSSSASWPTPSSAASACAIERGDKLANAAGTRAAGDRGRIDAEFLEQLLRRFVVFGVNPGGVERLIAADDFQEAGRLHERGVAEAAHFQELLAALERAVLLAVLVHAAGRELIHARNVPQAAACSRC